MRTKSGDMNQSWRVEVHADRRQSGLGVKTLLEYGDLISLFVRRNVKVMYQQTALGVLWIVLKPLLTTVVFTVVFGGVIGVPTDGAPQFLFYLLGTSTWSLFASTVNEVSGSFIQNAGIFSKVYFPRLVVPVSASLTNLLSFFIQFFIFAAFLTYFVLRGGVAPHFTVILLFPIVIFFVLLLGFGVGLAVSALTTRYRDLQVAVGFCLQLWMFVTPVVYPISEVGGALRVVMLLNPMAPMVEAMRYIFLGSGELPLDYLLLGFLSALLLAFVGLLLFRRVDRNFVDTI